LNVSDPASWYTDRHPDLPFGGLVPATCFYCFGSIKVGDDVIVRAHFTKHPDFAAIGLRSPVANIIASDEGNLFELQFDGGCDVFVRGEIRKPHDGE